ncbi:hypothetical protein L7F22_033151 [Adiantum nelumboides]|nr:hypothetical protein [Adiantum nelumboides]
MHERWNRCVNKAHVQPCNYHTLLPLSDEAVSDSQPIDEAAAYNDFTYKGHRDVLSSTLCAGNTFVVNPDALTDVEDVDFYLVKCVAAKVKVEKGRSPYRYSDGRGRLRSTSSNEQNRAIPVAKKTLSTPM